MAGTIQTFRRPTEIPSAQGSRIPLSAAGQFGTALAGLGQKLAEIGKKKDESEALSTAQDVLNESRLGVENDLDELRRSGMNSTQFQKDSRLVFQKWQERASERSKTIKTPEGRTYLAQKLGEFSVTTQIALGDEFDKKFRDEQRAGVLMQVPGIEARATRARTPEEMQSAVDELRQFLGSHTNYALTQEEATKTYLESVDNIREQRFRDAILADPVSGLNILGSDQAKDLNPAQADRLARFATAQINAQEAAARREEAAETRAQTLKKKMSETAFTRDVIRGRDIVQKLAGPEGRDLDGPTMRALVDFQRSLRTAGAEGPSDPAELLRWRIAARTGRDPATGQAVKWTDIGKAQGLNSDNKGDLIEKLFDRNEKAQGKAETHWDRRVARGRDQIRLLLSGKDGLLATLTGSSGDTFNDLNMYEALTEFDKRTETIGQRNPTDTADEIAFKYAQNVISRFAGSSTKILAAYNVKTLDELLDKAESGEIPRAQADNILRLGQFLKKADQKPPVTEGEDPVIEEGRGAFRALKELWNKQIISPDPTAARSRTPSAPSK